MPPKYATKRRVDKLNRELKSIETIESNPFLLSGINNRTEFDRTKKRIKDEIRQVTPPQVKDQERKALESRRGLLAKAIQSPIPEVKKPAYSSEKDQWDRKSGAVGIHNRNKAITQHYNLDANGRVVKSAYSMSDEYKDLCRTLDWENEDYDPDNASLEKLRPSVSPHSSAADYMHMTYAPGRGISEDQYQQAVEDAPDITCQSNKKNGEKCGSVRLPGTKFCRHHQEQADPPVQSAPEPQISDTA